MFHQTRLTILRHRRLAVAGAVIGAAVVLNGVTAAPVGPPATFAEIDAWLDHEVRDSGYPGAAAVIVEDGAIVHTHATGVADDAGRAVTPQTPFVIGSLSKSFTALAVGQLVDAGLVALDAPVQRYLPDFRLADPAAASAITVRQLLDQTSGLSGATGQAPLATSPTTLEARVRDLATVALSSAPGATFQYSNANYLVLGRLIEVVSGQAYGDYLAEHVFAPLDMRHSWTDLASAQGDGLTRSHRFWFGLVDSRTPLLRSDLVPAGFIAMSAEDLGHALIAQMDGGRYGAASVASPATIATLQRGVAVTDPSGQRYAMGWFDGSIGGERSLSHAGSTTDMASYMALVPGRRLAVAVLFNGQSALYETLHKPDSIGLAMTERLMGVEPIGTEAFLYPAFDLVAILVLAGMARGTLLAARPSLARPWTPRRWLLLVVRAYADVVVPMVILTRFPSLFGAGWDVMIRVDIDQVVAAIAVLRIADGVVRIAGWVRARRAPTVALATVVGYAP